MGLLRGFLLQSYKRMDWVGMGMEISVWGDSMQCWKSTVGAPSASNSPSARAGQFHAYFRRKMLPESRHISRRQKMSLWIRGKQSGYLARWWICVFASQGAYKSTRLQTLSVKSPPHTHTIFVSKFWKIIWKKNLINMFWQCWYQGKPWENSRNSSNNGNFVPVFFKHMWCSTGRNRSLPNYRQGESPKAIFPPWPHSCHTFLLLYMYLFFCQPSLRLTSSIPALLSSGGRIQTYSPWTIIPWILTQG